MKNYTDYVIYLVFEIFKSIIIIYFFGLNKTAGIILTIFSILSPILIYVKYKGLGILEKKFKDTRMKNILNVLNKKKSSSKIDKVTFVSYFVFIFFGILLMLLGE